MAGRSVGRLRWPAVGAAGVALVVLVASLVGMFDGFDLRMTDQRQPAAPLSDELVVVGFDQSYGSIIDAVSLSSLTTPDTNAAILLALERAGATVVVYPDMIVQVDHPRRRVLQRAVARATTLLPMDWDVSGFQDGVVTGSAALPVFPEQVAASSQWRTHDAGVGDGVARAAVVFAVADEPEIVGPVPSAAVAAVALHDGYSGPLGIESGRLRFGERVVPLDDHGLLRINYTPALHPGPVDRFVTEQASGAGVPATEAAAGQGTPYVSVGDLVNGSADDRIRGRIAVVVNAFGLSDVGVPVPNLDVQQPSGYVLANAVNTVLTGAYLVPLGDAGTAVLVVVAALIGFLLGLAPLWLVGPGTAAGTAGYVVLATSRVGAGSLWPVVGPAAALVLGAAVTFGLRYLLDSRQRRRIAGLFAQYVPPAVARRLIEDEQRAEEAAAGERLTISVLFCDLRGFTTLASRLAPADVRDLLNVYYRHAAQLVLERRGTVMQYVGDEVFAVFGAPLAMDDHAQAAVQAAAALQQRASDIAAELDGLGIPGIGYGIGVHTGEVVAAHVGDEQSRKQYAVVGDAVNVGARLCSLARAGEVVVSGDVVAQAGGDLAVEPMEPIELKGVTRAIDLYRLVVPTPVAETIGGES